MVGRLRPMIEGARFWGMSASLTTGRRDATATVRRLDVGQLVAAAAAQGATTQEQIADLCGIYRGTLYRYRTGRIVPDWSTADRIARRLGLTFDALMPVVDSRPPVQPDRPAGPDTPPPPAGPKTTPPPPSGPPSKPKNRR